MNSLPLIGAAFAMGASGSLHCIAMCSALQRTATGAAAPTAVQASASCANPRGEARRNGWFQTGRIAGYASIGAVAGLSGQWLLSAAAWQPVFHSVWAALNALLLVLGLSMIALGRQPAWLDAIGDKVWRIIRPSAQPIVFSPRHADSIPATGKGSPGPLPSAGPSALALALRGAAWALLPCGLLYSALALAILASDPLQAGTVMAAFAIGTTIGLTAFQSVLSRLPALAGRIGVAGAGSSAGADRMVFRFNGAMLATMASIALVAAIGGHANPFCAV